MPNIEVGDVLDGKYKITGVLGSGSMGVVYEALHTRLQRKVALKTLRAEYAANARLLDRFEREARASSAIGHPNIIQIFDAGGETAGIAYLAMERLHGQSLGDLLREKKVLETSRAIGICCQLLEGLAAAHAAGILHRDIKPDNIFITQDKVGKDLVKILDFGISKFLDMPGSDSGDGIGNITQAGIVVGTPNYMSPEQVCASPDIDLRADLWSVICVLYKCLSGRTPFSGQTRRELMAATLQGQFIPLQKRCPDVPMALNAIVRRGLMPDLPDRYPNAKTLLQALKEVHVGSHADTIRAPSNAEETSVFPANETASDTLEDPTQMGRSTLAGAGPSVEPAADADMLEAFDNLADRFLAQESEKATVVRPAPPVATPAPRTATPAPPIATPAPRTATPTPPVATPAPTVGTPAPTVGTPAPPVGTPAPPVATSAGASEPREWPSADPFAPPGSQEEVSLDIDTSPGAGPEIRARAKSKEVAAPEVKAAPRPRKSGDRSIVTRAEPSVLGPFLLKSLLAVGLVAGAGAGYRYLTLGYVLPPTQAAAATLTLKVMPEGAVVHVNETLETERKISLAAGQAHKIRLSAKDRIEMIATIDALSADAYELSFSLSHPMFKIHPQMVAAAEETKGPPPSAAAVDRARAKLSAFGTCGLRLVEAIGELPKDASRPDTLWSLDRGLRDECSTMVELAADMPPKMPALDEATRAFRESIAAYSKSFASFGKSKGAARSVVNEREKDLRKTLAAAKTGSRQFGKAMSQAESRWITLEVQRIDQLTGDALHSQVRNLAVSSDTWMRGHLLGADGNAAHRSMSDYYGFLVEAAERRKAEFDASGVTGYLHALKPLLADAPGEHSLALHNYAVEVFNKMRLPISATRKR